MSFFKNNVLREKADNKLLRIRTRISKSSNSKVTHCIINS